jgi:(p)ppGpp synthase/HD superfamily hydrolase
LHDLPAAYDFAARMHSGQTRKGAAGEPYVNHVIDVAARVAKSPHADRTLILGALLHDVVEDTAGTAETIAEMFGDAVAQLVLEVTDNKALPKPQRKRLQEETVRFKSDHAKRIKLADKASNLAALAESPPETWDSARRAAYIDWAERVIAGCRGVDQNLEDAFDEALRRARRAMEAQA